MDQKKHPEYFYAHRKIKCIGLLPIEKMVDAWKMVKAELIATAPHGSKQRTRDFVRYFEDTYVNESEAIYTLSDWCFHQSHNRSQTCIEASHFCWHQKVGTHPMIWDFME